MTEKRQIIEVEEINAVREWSKQIQKIHGDPHPVKVVSRLPPNDMFVADIQGSKDLKEIWERFTAPQKNEFCNRYGNIAKLLSVTINVHAMRAALEFWDPTYRCFSFNTVELTPLIEEYEELLKVPLRAEGKIYYYDKTQTRKRTLSRIAGNIPALKKDNIIKKKGNREGVPINLFVQLIKENITEDRGLTLFALCLYGVILFPSIRGYIDIKVIKLFLQIQHGDNPTLPILAETIRSLGHCRIEGKGRFIGCASLLYVWLMSHLKYPLLDVNMPRINFSQSWMTIQDPIAECARVRQSSDLPKRDAWITFLSELKARDVVWTSPWMPMRPMIYRCGKSHVVPLLGPWGGTSYAPLLVLRQMSTEQFIPTVDGLRDLDFEYGKKGSEERIKQALESWKVIKKIKSGDSHDTTTRDYKRWFANKKKIKPSGKGKKKVTELEQVYEVGKIRIDPLNEKVNEPKKIIEVGETLVRQLEARAIEVESNLVEVRNQLKSQMKLEKENQRLNHENSRLVKVAKRWRDESVCLKKKIEVKEEYITDLRGNIKGLQQVISELKTALEIKRGQIIETEENNDSLRQSIENLQYRLNKCQNSAEKILQAYEHLHEEVRHLRDQDEANIFYINNAIQNLRMLCARARVFADWGADLRGGLHFLQPNGEELMEFLSVLCRELRSLGRFV